MAVPNPNQITSTLRMMPDAQLRQYAAMHKNDPYIFPMAFAESNARKQARSAQQAQSMGQPQGKVVDQAVAAMGPEQLPENQGIGALPAPNMQRMADGGIAGYGDDGEFNYAGADDSVVMMAGGGVAHFADKGAVRGPYSDDTTVYDPATGQPITGNYSTSGSDDRTTLERLGVFNPENRRALERADAAARARETGVPPTPVNPYNADTATRAIDYPSPATNKKLSTSSNIRPAASPTAPPAAVGTDYEARLKTLADASRPKVEGLEALAAQRKAAMEKLGVTGEVGDAQKLALEKEGAQAADDKKEMLWMALIKGGLAVAGGTSQHALKNIADGFGVGLEDAAKGMKELKLAEKERKRSLAAIEETRRAEKRGDVKDVIAAQEKSKDHLDNYNMHVMSSQTTFLGNQLQADSAMQVAKLHEQSANARSNAQIAATLNTPERQMWNQALKDHNGNTAAAFKELQSIKSEKFNAYQSYADYLKAFAGKETLQVPQAFSEYVSKFSVPTTTAPDKNAIILKQQ